MKSVIKRESEKKFPCLMIYEKYDLIVLFNEYGNGFVVHSGISGHDLGLYMVDWDMNVFKPFNGVIELSN